MSRPAINMFYKLFVTNCLHIVSRKSFGPGWEKRRLRRTTRISSRWLEKMAGKPMDQWNLVALKWFACVRKNWFGQWLSSWSLSWKKAKLGIKDEALSLPWPDPWIPTRNTCEYFWTSAFFPVYFSWTPLYYSANSPIYLSYLTGCQPPLNK